MQKKIVVTGANGQLGSEIRQIAGSEPHAFVFTDVDTLDLTNSQEAFAFLEKQLPDIIINCAAFTAVDKAQEDWKKAELINRAIPEMLGKYSQRSGCRIIHISTDYVFRGNLTRPLRENDPTGPESMYARSKLLGEKAILQFENTMVIRTSWLYSAFGNNFVKSMIRLLHERDELSVVYDQVGTPTWAADLAGAIMTIINHEEETAGTGDPPPFNRAIPYNQPGTLPGSGIYHYSNEGVASWYDFAYEIGELTGARCNIIPIETIDYPLPAPRPAYAVMSKEKIKEQFGLKIPHWKTSLKNCIDSMNR
jgi:dTDP-4-dehydrorhamnose reductase